MPVQSRTSKKVGIGKSGSGDGGGNGGGGSGKPVGVESAKTGDGVVNSGGDCDGGGVGDCVHGGGTGSAISEDHEVPIVGKVLEEYLHWTSVAVQQ